MAELQELGAKIVALSEKHIARIPLPDELLDAVLQAKGMKHREGHRRQLQFIGKLMRRCDNIEDIRDAYEGVIAIGQLQNRQFHEAERWRERLLEDSSSEQLQKLKAEHPALDIQHVRQLIRNAHTDSRNNRPPKNARKLFRYLRELIDATL